MEEPGSPLATGVTLAWTSSITAGVTAVMASLLLLSGLGFYFAAFLLIFEFGATGVTVITGHTARRLLRGLPRWERNIAGLGLLLGYGQLGAIVLILFLKFNPSITFGR